MRPTLSSRHAAHLASGAQPHQAIFPQKEIPRSPQSPPRSAPRTGPASALEAFRRHPAGDSFATCPLGQKLNQSPGTLVPLVLQCTTLAARPFPTSMKAWGKTNLFRNDLNPAHVPLVSENSGAICAVCDARMRRADIEGSKSNVARNAWLPQASYPFGNFSDTSVRVWAPQHQRIARPWFPSARVCWTRASSVHFALSSTWDFRSHRAHRRTSTMLFHGCAAPAKLPS